MPNTCTHSDAYVLRQTHVIKVTAVPSKVTTEYTAAGLKQIIDAMHHTNVTRTDGQSAMICISIRVKEMMPDRLVMKRSPTHRTQLTGTGRATDPSMKWPTRFGTLSEVEIPHEMFLEALG